MKKILSAVAASCLKAGRAAGALVFELWKTLPDTVKRPILLFVFGALTVALFPHWRGPQSNPPQQSNQPVSTCPPETEPSVDHAAPPPTASKPSGSRKARSEPYKPDAVRKGESSRVVANQLPTDESLAVAQQMLQRGNYAEAYRIYEAALTKKGQPALSKPAQEANVSYARGDFREAAYQMRRAFQRQ